MAGLQDISPMVAKLVRDQRRARAHARRRSRGLAAGMAAADDDDVEGCIVHGATQYDLSGRRCKGSPKNTQPKPTGKGSIFLALRRLRPVFA